jgi:hypothetical protein
MVHYYIENKRLDVERVDNIIETKAGKSKRPPMRYVRKGLGVTSTSLERLKKELREPPTLANQEGTEHTASQPSDPQGADPTPPRKRRGPKRLARTLEIGEFCYRQLAEDVLRSSICEKLRERFGRTMSESDVTTYARRFAQDTGKAWPL